MENTQNITIKNDYSEIILHEVIAIQAKIDALAEVLLTDEQFDKFNEFYSAQLKIFYERIFEANPSLKQK